MHFWSEMGTQPKKCDSLAGRVAAARLASSHLAHPPHARGTPVTPPPASLPMLIGTCSTLEWVWGLIVSESIETIGRARSWSLGVLFGSQ